ncbi:hypothetical protein GLOIN_2v1815051 [Rhizophagus irregularis DAOM 181602=DAOM 197198]|uniref:Myb/SANT-like DNA-binding domain-containing protein n=1 Tax=Rhizophagus irregularis (strain DAOM 197198w) TaxID=1432141 RepID=A0A015J543_RHIIW|nr:hypothetical protein RirG_167260 [Rhizophagus irregularis DAOM 197198w]GBC54145.2 hypothetical protein GLOIN_2v1815051 [Rhizophagus irregularis DAOM 181602=DAOM 197198]
MAALIPFVPPPPPVFQWTINATRQLIAERRNIHQQFERISNRHHVSAWTIIANRVFAATGFAVTSRQCSTKWNALKRGYENLSRIINNNDDDIPIVSPNSFDRACFTDMNDEFWLQTDESIDGGMLDMIDVDMNIDCKGKEGGHDLGLDQEVEIEVEIEDKTEVEIEDGIEVEIEEEVEAGPHIEDKDIKF